MGRPPVGRWAVIDFDADVEFSVDESPAGMWTDPPETARFLSLPLFFSTPDLAFDARLWIEGLALERGRRFSVPVSFLYPREVRRRIAPGTAFVLRLNGRIGEGVLLSFRASA